MPRIESTDESLVLATGTLSLAFRREGERWSHEIAVGGRVVAGSMEWEAGRDDPARVVSPAYQQIGYQEGPEGAQALLVGQWGPHHFSAVFTVSEGEGSARVEVDVAVRTRGTITNFASTYSLALTSGDLEVASERAIRWSLEEPIAGQLGIVPEGDGSRVMVGEAGRTRTRVQVEGALRAGTATQRLRYCWEWADAAR